MTFHLENHSLTREKVLSVHSQKNGSQLRLDIFTSQALLSNCNIQSNAISSKKFYLDIREGFVCSVALPDNNFIISKSETKRKYWLPVEEFEFRHSYWVERTESLLTMKKLALPSKERYEYVTHAREIVVAIPKNSNRKRYKQVKYILMATNLGKIYSMRRKGLSHITLVRSFESPIKGMFSWYNEYYVYIWIYCTNGTLYELKCYMSNFVAAARRCTSAGGGQNRRWEHPFRFISNAHLPGFVVFSYETIISEISNVDSTTIRNQQQPLKFIFDPEEEAENADCPPCAWSLQISASKICHGPLFIESECQETIHSSVPPSAIRSYQCITFDNLISTESDGQSGVDIMDYAMTLHHFIVTRSESTGVFVQVLSIPPRLVQHIPSSSGIYNKEGASQYSNFNVKRHHIVLNVPLHSKQVNVFCHSGHFSLEEDAGWNQVYVFGANSVLVIKIGPNEHKKVSNVYCKRAMEVISSEETQQIPTKEIQEESNYYFKLAYRSGTSDYIRECVLKHMAVFYLQIHEFNDAADLLAGTQISIEEATGLLRERGHLSVKCTETTQDDDIMTKLKRNKGLRKYLMVKSAFKQPSFSLFEFPIQHIKNLTKVERTWLVLWILDLYLYEIHLSKNLSINLDNREMLEFVKLLANLNHELFEVKPCYYLLLNNGYQEEATMLAEDHELSEQLAEFFITEALFTENGVRDIISTEEFFRLLRAIDAKQTNQYSRNDYTQQENMRGASSLNFIKQSYNYDPLKTIQWLEFSNQSTSEPQISDLISLCPIMWSPDTDGIKNRSKDVLLPYFQVWSQVSENMDKSAPSIRLPSINQRNEDSVHSCASALVCIHDMLTRDSPVDTIEFLQTIHTCSKCIAYILRKVTNQQANFITLALRESVDIGGPISLNPSNENMQKLYRKVNCSHLASICHFHLQQDRLAIKYALAAAANLFHFEEEESVESTTLRRYFLSMARKIANHNSTNEDALSTEVEEYREDLWSFLLDEFCNLYLQPMKESNQPTNALKQEQFSSDLSSFLIETQKSTTPIRATAKIISLLPSKTMVSSFKQNMITYCQRVRQEMTEIKNDSQSHITLLKELKHMAFSNNHFKQEFVSNCSCSSPLCGNPVSFIKKEKWNSDVDSFIYSFSCGHHFHFSCIEELILLFPSHEEILRFVEEKGMDIRLFPMRHAITKLTLQQLNRRYLFFQRAAEYARSQSLWKKNTQKYLNSIFKRCLKQLVIISKKHQLFKHECPLCNGMYTANILIPLPIDSSWDLSDNPQEISTESKNETGGIV